MSFENFVTILIVVFVIGIFLYKKYSNSSKSLSTGQVVTKSEGPVKQNLFGPQGIKLMSYKEALEASKQFIYDITREVMQKFTPDAKCELSEVGKKLMASGTQYMHIVDVFSLSLHKKFNLGKKKDIQPKQKSWNVQR